MDNIICYNLSGDYLDKFYQWDRGQAIIINGLDNSLHYELDLCHSGDAKTFPVPITVTDNGLKAEIPDEMFLKPIPIVLYIKLISGDLSERTIYSLRVPIVDRPKPSEANSATEEPMTNTI